ncbi:ead/Ea22-like family protein [Citrobacter freundii]|nr:ead/Ea22-like family protein [Citrobacter freundii]
MSSIDKRALREAAEKATKGQWAVEFDDEIYSTDGVNHEQIAMVFSENEARDAAFIAAANPTAVLALLDELKAKDSTIATQQQEIRTLLNALGQASEKRNAEQAGIIAKQEKWIKDVEETMISATDRAEAAEKRIAELEGREVVLPSAYDVHPLGPQSAKIFCEFHRSIVNRCADEIRKIGVKVSIKGN